MMGRPGVWTHPQALNCPKLLPINKGDGLSCTSKGPPGGGPFESSG